MDPVSSKFTARPWVQWQSPSLRHLVDVHYLHGPDAVRRPSIRWYGRLAPLAEEHGSPSNARRRRARQLEAKSA